MGVIFDQTRNMYPEFANAFGEGFANGKFDENKYEKALPLALKIGKNLRYSEEEAQAFIAEGIISAIEKKVS